jgi:hypothetical protein
MRNLSQDLPENLVEFRDVWWVVVQIKNWARTKLWANQIRHVVEECIVQDPFYIYIPVVEDCYGKQDFGYGEYLFINCVDMVDYFLLEKRDEFTRILKDPHTKQPQLISGEQLALIRERIREEVRIKPGHVIRVIRGNLRGNYGTVENVNGQQVTVIVRIGQEAVESTVPVYWVRRSRKSVFGQQDSVNLELNGFAHLALSSGYNFGEVPRVRVLRRGLRHTTVLVDQKRAVFDNEQVDEFLLQQSTEVQPSEEKLNDEEESSEPDFLWQED